MTPQSMTGFSRAAGQHDGVALAWEARSLNGKAVDVRTRLPQGFERLEPQVRQHVAKRFSRGTIQLTLTATRPAGSVLQPTVNEAFLMDLAGLARRLELQFGAAPARADGLLALRGVLELPEAVETEEARLALDAAALSLLGEALTRLGQSRQSEGAALAAVLASQVDAIEALTLRIEADPSREAGFVRERLSAQVALLMAIGAGLDEARLYQEAALLATKADTREEIDRLTAHVAAARTLLAQGGVVGRKLDFLAQEFNREANTLGSKANAGSVVALGLELKAVVDQFREQVQNLE